MSESERCSRCEELDLKDPNFESELTFDGYANIEDYDNGAYQVREMISEPEDYTELWLIE